MEAKLVIDAEKFFSTVYTEGQAASWNVRTEHMVNTVEEIFKHITTKKRPPKLVIWQHNSHVGDSNAIENNGEISLSRMLKDKYGKENVYTIGMTACHGTIYASTSHDTSPDILPLRQAKEGSWESILHKINIPAHALIFRSNDFQITVDKEMKVNHRHRDHSYVFKGIIV